MSKRNSVFFKILIIVFWLSLLFGFLFIPLIKQKLFSQTRSLNVFTWVDVINLDKIAEFEKEKDIKINFSFYENAQELLAKLRVTKGEEQLLDQALKIIADRIAEKEEDLLLSLSDDDKALLSQFQEIEAQRLARRKEIKARIEDFRKIVGGSGLDFEKSMTYNELLAAEKEQLEKIDHSLEEVQAKMRSLKGQ